MIFLLHSLASGECQVFFGKAEFDFYVIRMISSDERDDFIYFKLPDDFCIPVKHLHHALLITDCLETMGYSSFSFIPYKDDGD